MLVTNLRSLIVNISHQPILQELVCVDVIFTAVEVAAVTTVAPVVV